MGKLIKRKVTEEVFEAEPGDLEGVDAEEFYDDEADEPAANDDVEPEVERKFVPRRAKK